MFRLPHSARSYACPPYFPCLPPLESRISLLQIGTQCSTFSATVSALGSVGGSSSYCSLTVMLYINFMLLLNLQEWIFSRINQSPCYPSRIVVPISTEKQLLYVFYKLRRDLILLHTSGLFTWSTISQYFGRRERGKSLNNRKSGSPLKGPKACSETELRLQQHPNNNQCTFSSLLPGRQLSLI